MHQQRYQKPKDIWEKAKAHVAETNGALISEKIELVRWQYSGTEHDIVRTETLGDRSLPLNRQLPDNLNVN